MHRVMNYGSALQAFALVEYLRKLGCQAEVIDYVFPNHYHIRQSLPSFFSRLKLKTREVLRLVLLEPFLQRNMKFAKFRRKNMSLSSRKYKSISELHSFIPDYDMYITGSDQVWNESKIFEDNSFFCDFADSGKKIISFGASITTNKLTDTFKERLKKYLSRYSAIGVREASSLPLIKSLHLPNQIKVFNTCDPTLLLESCDYDKLALESKIHIDYDYVLVHQLEYNFSAEPAISEVIKSAKQYFNCGMILIDHMFRRIEDGDHKFCSLGPNEFIWLFKHAKAVVTSSFHGTMFSIIYRKPFVSVAPPKEHLDSRIADTLEEMGLANHLIFNSGEPIALKWIIEYSTDQEEKIGNYINKSKNFLQENISCK